MEIRFLYKKTDDRNSKEKEKRMKKISRSIFSLMIIACMMIANFNIGIVKVHADETADNAFEYPVTQDAYIRSKSPNTNYDYEEITSAHGSQYVGKGYKSISTKYAPTDEIISAMKVKLPTEKDLEEKQFNKFVFEFHMIRNPGYKNGDQTYIYYYSSDTNWDEKTLTWNTKPSFMKRNAEKELFRFKIAKDENFEAKTEDERTMSFDVTDQVLELIHNGVEEITIFGTGDTDCGMSIQVHAKETAPAEFRPKLIGSFDEYTKEMLTTLVDQCTALKESDYTKDTYSVLKEKLVNANKVLAAQNPTNDEIKVVYKELENAYKNLVSVLDPNDADNIAYQKPTRSNLAKQEVYKVTDGDVNTYWKGTFYPSYVDIDLMDVYKLTDLKLFVPTGKIVNYTIYGSNDGKNYDKLYQTREQQSALAQGDKIHFDQPQSYRIIRVYMEYTKGENAAYVSEVRAYGTKTNTNEEELRKGTFEDILGIQAFEDTAYAALITKQETYDNIYGIIDRTIGAEYRDWFTFELDPTADAKMDYFELSNLDGKIHIKGNVGTSITYGLNYYFKNYLKVQISEQTMQVNMPKEIVKVEGTVRKETPYKVRYAYNYCTLSYTFAFFGEEEWQRENDWLALNGVNVVLDVAGQEATWIKFLMNFGYSFDDAKDWLVGPSYYAWQFMQNIETFGGPIPDQYVVDRVELARTTQRWKNSLGMNTVLQGYAGMVPTNFNEFQPNVPLTAQKSWGGLARPSMIPTDSPYYDEYAKLFYEAQEYIYGATSDYYAVDPYHEGGTRPEGLSDETVAREVLNSLLDYDKDAVWVVQAWQSNPTDGLLNGMGEYRENHVLIVDLIKYPIKSWTKYNKSEFKGTSWAWGLLGGFGGNPTMNGEMQTMVNDIQTAKKERTHMAGLGIISEAQYDNPVLYDLIFDLAWVDDDFSLDQWLNKYIERRYGGTSDNAKEAWKIMKNANYNHGVRFTAQVYGMKGKSPQDYGKQNISYGADKLETAFRLLIEDYDKFKDSECYRYDLTEIMRQMVSNYSTLTYNNVIDAREDKNIEKFKEEKAKFLKSFDVLNDIQETQVDQLAGEWIGKAQDRAADYDDFAKDAFEMNAKALITSWASRSSAGGLKDYAWRNYQGMFIDLYKQNWIDYLDQVEANLENGSPITFAANFEVYWKWVLGDQTYTRVAKDSPEEMQVVIQEVLDNCMLSGEMDPNAGNKALHRVVKTDTKKLEGALKNVTDGDESNTVTFQNEDGKAAVETSIDLVGEFQLSQIQVVADACTFDKYEIYTSVDQQAWKKVGEVAAADIAEKGNVIEVSDAIGRFVKVTAIAGNSKDTHTITYKEIRVYGEQVLATMEQLQRLVAYADTIDLTKSDAMYVESFTKALQAAKEAIKNDENLDNVNTVYWALYDNILNLNLSDLINLGLTKVKKVTAMNDPSGNSQQIVDGEIETGWNSGRLSPTGKPYQDDPIMPGWVIIELDDVYNISDLNVQFSASRGNLWHNYELYTSVDGNEWVKVGEKTSQNKPNKAEDSYALQQVKAKFIKMVTTNIQREADDQKRSSYNVGELQIMGSAIVKVDTTALEALIAEVKALKKDDYTAQSYQIVTNQLEVAEALLKKDEISEEDVKKVAFALQSAKDALVEKASVESVTKLESLVKEAKGMKDAYSEDSFKDVQAAMDAAESLLKDLANMSEEDAKESISMLSSAIETLKNVTLQEAKKQLSETIQQARALLEDETIAQMTAESVKALQAALTKANEVYEDQEATLAHIKEAQTTLTKAIKGLEPIKTDTSALRTLIAAVEQLAETDYTANSYKVVAEKLQVAKAVLEKTNPSAEEVKKAELALQNAQKALVVRASKESVAVLKRLVEDGKKMKDAYTEEAFKDVQTALDLAQGLLTDPSNMAEVTTKEVVLSLSTAIDALHKLTLQEAKEQLTEMITYADTLLKADTIEQMTAESVQALQTALKQAKEVIANEKASLEQIKTTHTTLVNAVKGLKPQEPVTPDTTALQTLIKEVEKVTADLYTVQSYEALSKKLQDAKAVLEKTNPSADEVSKAELELQSAKNALVVRASKESVEILETLVEEGTKLKDTYTKDEFKDVQTALTLAESLLKDPSNMSDEETKEVVLSLSTAIQALKDLTLQAAKKQLLEMIQYADVLLKGEDIKQMTPKSVQALQTTLKQAKEVYKDEKATLEDIKAMHNTLVTAIKKLEVRLDTTKLDREITIVEDMLNHIDRYEPSSVAKLKDAFQHAKDVKKTAKNQQELDEALRLLKEERQKAIRLKDKDTTIGDKDTNVIDKEKTEGTKDTVDVPTGDTSATGVFAGLLIIAGGAIITLVKRKKRV